MEDIKLKDYLRFVDGVTSNSSKDLETLITRLRELHANGCDVPRLLTAGIGLASESGEFDEIVKKLAFQGKPWNDETKFHLFRELGDISWYWAQACLALGIDPQEVLKENIRKLESRYPGGKFDPHYSENRKTNDL